MFRVLQNVGESKPDARTKPRLEEGLKRVRGTAAPLLEALNREQRIAVSSDEGDSQQN